jgi:hypothetical protein
VNFPPILELSFAGVYEAGVGGSERILLRPNQPLNLAQFGIVLTVPQGFIERGVIQDALFWFPDRVVSPTDWVFVYTGPGVAQVTRMPSGETAYVYHWGRPQTVFGVTSPGLLPTVIRASAITSAPLY